MTHPTGWPTAQSICDIPEVRAALDAFAQEANEENMLAMVSAIMTHSPASVRAAALPATISEADAKRLYDQAYYDHTDEPMALTFAKLVLEHAALSAAPAGGLGMVKPICYIKYFTAQQWSGNGNHDIQIYEGYQVCDEGDDGAIPVAPIAAAQGEGK